jgi:hypothetical protein
MDIYLQYVSRRKKLVTNLLFIALVVFSSCKKDKVKGLHDEAWRTESMKMASEICKKYAECAPQLLLKIKPSLHKLFWSEIKEEKCAEKNKESNIYKLAGEKPDTIKEHTRNCYKTLIHAGCTEIANDITSIDPNCVAVRKIQKSIR